MINKLNKKCHHCNTQITPKWRRDKYTYNVLCNACGLKINKTYKKVHIDITIIYTAKLLLNLKKKSFL